MRGRKPKPIEQRVKEGNPQNRPLPAPILVDGRPVPGELAEPPEHLPAIGKEFWRDTVVKLVDIGIVDRIDVPMLEQLSTQYARLRQAQAVLRQEGHYTRGSVGQIVEHPAMRIEREATTLFMRLAEHYALTPIARVRLGMAEIQRRSLQQEMDSVLGDVETIDVKADEVGVEAKAK